MSDPGPEQYDRPLPEAPPSEAPPSEGSPGEVLPFEISSQRLIRVLRLSHEADLTEEARSDVGGEVLSRLGVLGGDPDPIEAVAPASPERREGRDPECQALELKLRQLSHAEAKWDRMEPIALDLAARDPRPETLAKVTELAFLSAPVLDVVDLITRFRAKTPHFYRRMHPAIRAHLVTRIYTKGISCEALAGILFAERDAEDLQPTERLYLLLSLVEGHDPTASFMYFRRYERSLVQAAEAVWSAFGVGLPQLYLTMGRIAVELGDTEEARRLLDLIPAGVAEREEALVLLLQLDTDRTKAGLSHYAEELEGAPGDHERLAKLGAFLAATRGLGGYRDRGRPALNEILRQPLSLINENPDVWVILSNLLVENRDLEGLLPHILTVFRAHILVWNSPLLDAALWQGPLRLPVERPADCYLKGVATLHQYVSSQGLDPLLLWDARDLVHKGRAASSQEAPYDWAEIHRSGYAWIAKNHYLMEVDRARILREMRVAGPDQTVSLDDIEAYLNHDKKPLFPILSRLADIARAKGAMGVEARLIVARGYASHLTNRDLNRLWQVGCERRDPDLAWRVATILRARGVLASAARHAWEISGEKRAHYPMFQLQKEHVDIALDGLTPLQQRLARAVLTIGPLIPELLASVDPKVSASRVGAAANNSIEGQVDQVLLRIDWLPPLRKRYRFSFQEGGSALADQLPFAQVLPANVWSVLVVRLAERLGLTAWRWRLSLLAEQVVHEIPRLAARGDHLRHGGRVARWLRNLSPEERSAWQELSSLSRSMKDDDAMGGLAALVSRLAVMIMPNHFMAICSLMTMRAPLAHLWHLELFVVGESYSALRQKLGVAHKVLVPNSLLRLPSIVEFSSTETGRDESEGT